MVDGGDKSRRRNNRLRGVRSVTITERDISRKEIEIDRVEYSDELKVLNKVRPQTRAECHEGVRPCPFVGCRMNLYLDISTNGRGIKLNFPDLEPGDMPHDESCALDVAEQGGLQLERVGDLMNMTRERVRQIEGKAFRVMKKAKQLKDEDMK